MASKKASRNALAIEDVGASIERWQADTVVRKDHETGTGPIGSLFNSLVEVLGLMLVDLKARPDMSQHYQSLESSSAALFFWGTDLDVSRGELDEVLQDSTQLRDTCLLVLASIGQFIVSSFIRLLSTKDRQQEVLDSTGIVPVLEQAMNILDQQDYPPRNPEQDEKALGRTLRMKIDTLLMLAPSLASPAEEDFDDEEPRVIDHSEEHLPEQAYINNVAQRFPLAASTVVSHLGKLNWERYNHMLRLQRNATQQEVETTVMEKARTIFHDSALGSSMPAQSETSQDTPAIPVKPQSVYAPSMVSSRAEASHKRLPPLPPQARLGQPFTCAICNKQVRYQRTKAWKKHIFGDILAYSCLFNECSVANIFFEDSDAMMSHLEQHHDFDVSSSAVTCPLCFEYTSDDRGALALHFARHMEEIALAIIPSGVDSDAESGVETPSEAETGQFDGESAHGASEAETVELTAVKAKLVSELNSLEASSDDQEEEDEITRCICGHLGSRGLQYNIETGSPTPVDDLGGLFIQCDGCKVWQHGGCVGILDEAESPDEYFCETCRQDLHEIMTGPGGQKYSQYIPVISKRPASVTVEVGGQNNRSSSWSAKEDDILIQARAQGLNWNQIASKHFPNKSPSACRKRHERLLERQSSLKKNEEEEAATAAIFADGRHWSIEEEYNLEINLARFGTDWLAIADRMGTKTLTEVKNHYLHLVETGRSDLEDVAKRADARPLEITRLRRESSEKDARLRQLEQAVMELQQSRDPDSKQTVGEVDMQKYADHPQSPGPAQGSLDESYDAALRKYRQENEKKDARLIQLENAIMALQQQRRLGEDYTFIPISDSESEQKLPAHITSPTGSQGKHYHTYDPANNDRPYKCRVEGCEKLQDFTNSEELLGHEREVHKMHGGAKKQLFCPHPNCEYGKDTGFTEKRNLDRHIRRDHRQVPRISDPQTATSIHDTNNHGPKEHRTNGGEFACPFTSCKNLDSFEAETSLKEHIRGVHGEFEYDHVPITNISEGAPPLHNYSPHLSSNPKDAPDAGDEQKPPEYDGAVVTVHQDQNGIIWIAFVYGGGGVKKKYTIRTDTESVNVDELPQDFRVDNCVYPHAYEASHANKSNHLVDQYTCNVTGWALAQLNPCLRGNQRLLRRAVGGFQCTRFVPRSSSKVLDSGDALIINKYAQRLMESCHEEIRQKFRQEVEAWPEEKKQALVNQGISPLFFRFREHAEELYNRGALNYEQLRSEQGLRSQQAANRDAMQAKEQFQRPTYPPVNPADQNLPCDTLYVGNLPKDTSEGELVAVFSKQRGFKRLSFRTKQNGPMCLVEFKDTSFAIKALDELYGYKLQNSVNDGIRLSYAQSPLGVRNGQNTSAGSSSSIPPPSNTYQDFDFKAIADQQARAMRAWDQGEEVVPASNTSNPFFS